MSIIDDKTKLPLGMVMSVLAAAFPVLLWLNNLTAKQEALASGLKIADELTTHRLQLLEKSAAETSEIKIAVARIEERTRRIDERLDRIGSLLRDKIKGP